jgi:hypothetical protein
MKKKTRKKPRNKARKRSPRPFDTRTTNSADGTKTYWTYKGGRWQKTGWSHTKVSP